MMTSAVDFLEANSGALLFLATVLLALVTLRLVGEAQLARIAADVVIQPMVWPRNTTAMSTDLHNVGAAAARDIRLTFRWEGPSGEQVGRQQLIRIPALVPGQKIPYHPDILLDEKDVQNRTIDHQADLGLVLRAEWSWVDGRRPLWLFGTKRNTARLDVSMTDFRERGPEIVEPDEVDRLVEAASEMVRMWERKQWLRDPDDLPVDVQVEMEAEAMRGQFLLWWARFRRFVLRRRR
jgi:hypothetical protein